MIARWQESNLREALEERRGVHLTGVRQCGKTTLSEHVAADGMRHVSLDEALMREAAEDDPAGFTSRPDGKTLVIDEIQKVPALLDAIKIRLDHDNTKGQYLLTGSSNLRFAKKIKDSLAVFCPNIPILTSGPFCIWPSRADIRKFRGSSPSRDAHGLRTT